MLKTMTLRLREASNNWWSTSPMKSCNKWWPTGRWARNKKSTWARPSSGLQSNTQTTVKSSASLNAEVLAFCLSWTKSASTTAAWLITLLSPRQLQRRPRQQPQVQGDHRRSTTTLEDHQGMPAAPVAGLINNAIADPWPKLRPSRALCLALSVASGTAVKYLQVCRHIAKQCNDPWL